MAKLLKSLLRFKFLGVHVLEWFIVFLFLILTFFVWRFSQNLIQEERERVYEKQIETFLSNFEKEKDHLFDHLVAAKSMIASLKNDLTRKRWRDYYRFLESDQKLDFLLGFGFLSRVTQKDLSSFVKKQEKMHGKFKPFPEIKTDEDLFIVTYVEPEEPNKKAIGLISNFNINRKSIIVEAGKTGKTLMTEVLSLVQDIEKRPGAVIFMPIYEDFESNKKPRYEKFRGMIYVPFIVEAFINNTLKFSNQTVKLKVWDGDFLVYESDDIKKSSSNKKTVEVDVFGRKWKMEIHPNVYFKDRVLSFPTAVLIFGLVITTLIFYIFYLNGRNRKDSKINAEKIRNKYNIAIQKLQDANDGLIREVKHKNEAKKVAVMATEGKSLFLASMSHEIKTPLNGLLGMIDLLSSTPLSAEQKRLFENIKISGESLLNIINDILDFSQIDAGKFKPKEESYNFKKLINKVIWFATHHAQSKNLILRTKVDKTIPKYLWGDAVKVKQILTNIMNNVIKCADKGEIHFDVKNKKNKIHFIFEDRDIYLTKEEISNFFHEYSDAKKLSTLKYDGTGIGLTISKKVAKKMGGDLIITSSQEDGTVYSLVLPLKEGKETLYDKETSPIKINKSFALNFPHKILIVEDNKINQQFVKKLLEKFGYNVEVADDGFDAIKKFKKMEETSLIFMDLNMPRMNGFEATEEILKCVKQDPPFIIALTANTFEEDRKKCFEVGMCDFLVKPVNLNVMRDILIKYSKLAGDHSSKRYVIFDEKALNTNFNDNLDVIQKIVGHLQESLPKQLENLERSYDQRDVTQLSVTAHILRGMSANLFSTDCKNVAAEVERIARNGKIPEPEKIDLMKSLFRNLLDQLEATYSSDSNRS